MEYFKYNCLILTPLINRLVIDGRMFDSIHVLMLNSGLYVNILPYCLSGPEHYYEIYLFD